MIRGSTLIILFGHLLYTLPFMFQSVTNTLRSYNFFELERAAAGLGANWYQRLRYILLPNLKHALIIGSLLVFTISLGEFNASFLLTTPITLTLPRRFTTPIRTTASRYRARPPASSSSW
jgi:putative spermidine/putrescine transport system permease protein